MNRDTETSLYDIHKLKKGERNQLIARAAEYFVAAELNRRGAYAITFSGNMPNIDILASNASQTRTIKIQVKAKFGKGDWQLDACKFIKIDLKSDETQEVVGTLKNDPDLYLVFVAFIETNNPEYYIIQWRELCEIILSNYKQYLEKHGGIRPKNPESTHCKIKEKQIESWHNKWNILPIWK